MFELAAVLELFSAKEHHSNEVPLATNDLVQQDSAGTLGEGRGRRRGGGGEGKGKGSEEGIG